VQPHPCYGRAVAGPIPPAAGHHRPGRIAELGTSSRLRTHPFPHPPKHRWADAGGGGGCVRRETGHSFNRRYAPLHRQARELWGDRVVALCVLEKHRASAAHPDLFSNYIDDTIHIIDLLRFFCGDGEVVSTVQQMRQGRLVGAVSTVTLQSGGYGMVVTSLQAGRWTERYALHGDGASMYLDAFSRLRLVIEEGERVWEENYASSWKPALEARGFVDQIAHFFECVRSRKQPLTSGWEAFKTQRLLEDMITRVED
jgi:virulence factor